MRIVNDTLAAAALVFGYSVKDLLAPGRMPTKMRALQAAMLVARRHPSGPSYPELGLAFGRDHTTIMNGVRRAEQFEAESEWYAGEVQRIVEIIRGVQSRRCSGTGTTRAA